MMGFNPTFYAGRPKLSQVTIDSDLNMGGRNISNVDTLGVDTIGANLIRAGRVDSPYRPEPWPTETLGWGDVAPFETETHTNATVLGSSSGGSTFTILTATKGRKVTVEVTRPATGGDEGFIPVLKINDVDIQSMPRVNVGQTKQFNPVVLNAGDVLTIHATSTGASLGSRITIVLKDSGLAVGAKTFDLTGKWLALGLDMKGLAATVKIQGVEIPYSDYAKYFPLAPSELKIPGNWSPSQERPVIKVYK